MGLTVSQPPIAMSGSVVIIALGGMSRYWSRHLFDRVRFEHRPANVAPSGDVALPSRSKTPSPSDALVPVAVWAEEELEVEDEPWLAGGPGMNWLFRRGARVVSARRGSSSSARRNVDTIRWAGTMRSRRTSSGCSRAAVQDEPDHLVVFPRVFTLEELGLRRTARSATARAGTLFEDPLRFAGLREYRPGDPLSRIDWKATARAGDRCPRLRAVGDAAALHRGEHRHDGARVGGLLEGRARTDGLVAASLAVWAAGARYASGCSRMGRFRRPTGPSGSRPHVHGTNSRGC